LSKSTAPITSDILKSFLEKKPTRRDFNYMLAAASLSITTMSHSSSTQANSGDITYMGWAGYDDPEFRENFIKKYGDLPAFDFWSDAEDGFVKLRSGAVIDVLHPCTDHMFKWRQAGMVAELDPERLIHLPDVLDYLKDIEGPTEGDKRYMMPLDWSLETVIYRTDLVDPEDVGDNMSWRIIYDDKYKGAISILDSSNTCVQLAAIVLGYDNIFTLSDEQLENVRELLIIQGRNLRYYWGSPTDVEQSLASGELVAAFGWPDMYARLLEQGVPVALGKPKEGVRTWACGLIMHPDTPNPDAAYDLINSFSSPEAGKYMLEVFGIGHCNKIAFDQASPEILEKFALSDPESFLKNGIFYEAMTPENEARYSEIYETAKVDI